MVRAELDKELGISFYRLLFHLFFLRGGLVGEIVRFGGVLEGRQEVSKGRKAADIKIVLIQDRKKN